MFSMPFNWRDVAIKFGDIVHRHDFTSFFFSYDSNVLYGETMKCKSVNRRKVIKKSSVSKLFLFLQPFLKKE